MRAMDIGALPPVVPVDCIDASTEKSDPPEETECVHDPGSTKSKGGHPAHEDHEHGSGAKKHAHTLLTGEQA